MQTMLAQTGPEVKMLPAEPNFFDDGSAFYPSRTTTNTFYDLFASLQNGRMVVTECGCEAGKHGRMCWHRRAYQAHLDSTAHMETGETLIEAAALAAADFERAWSHWRMNTTNAAASDACNTAHKRLEAAREAVAALYPTSAAPAVRCATCGDTGYVRRAEAAFYADEADAEMPCPECAMEAN